MTEIVDPSRLRKVVFDPRVDERPPTILYGWYMLPSGCLYGEYVENHPTLGSGPHCFTTKVQYIDETIGIAKTRNTNYILRNKKSNVN